MGLLSFSLITRTQPEAGETLPQCCLPRRHERLVPRDPLAHCLKSTGTASSPRHFNSFLAPSVEIRAGRSKLFIFSQLREGARRA